MKSKYDTTHKEVVDPSLITNDCISNLLWEYVRLFVLFTFTLYKIDM